MRSSATPITVDLAASGANSVAVTPGASFVPVQFTLPAPQFDVRGNYPSCVHIAVHVTTTFDQAAAGGAVVNWDALPEIIDSFQVLNPLMGVTHEQSTYTGPITKHLIEFISQGYEYFGGARAQIPAADGDTVVDLYFALPFTMECFDRPLDFCPWVGWLANMQLTVNFAAASAIGTPAQGGSTGAVTKAPTTIKAWLALEPRRQLCVNAFAQWRLYSPSAAGSTQQLLQNVGQQGGLTIVNPGSRIAALAQMFNQVGLGGATTLENITSLAIPLLNQSFTTNVDSFILAARALAGPNRGPFSGIGATIMHPNAGWPYTMGSSPNNAFGQAAGTGASPALIGPWRLPGNKSRIAKHPRFQGNLVVVEGFAAPVVSGNHPFVTCELRQTSPSGAAGLLQSANVSPSQVQGIRIDTDDAGPPPTRGSGFALPREVPAA